MRRRTKKKPKYSVDKTTGHARVYIGGKKVMLGRAGTPESYDKYEHVVDEFFQRQREEIEAEQAQKASVDEAGLTWQHFVKAGITPTIAELAEMFVSWAEEYYRKNGERNTRSWPCPRCHEAFCPSLR